MTVGTLLARLLAAFDAEIATTVTALPRLWITRLKHRQIYRSLSPEQLRDAGLNPEHIAREAAKPFWRA